MKRPLATVEPDWYADKRAPRETPPMHANSLPLAPARPQRANTYSTPPRRTREILASVAAAFEVSVEDLKRRTNQHHIVRARQLAMYLVRNTTGASLPQIGRWFGGKHHTTVFYALRKIERERLRQPALDDLISAMMRKFPTNETSTTWPRPPHYNDFSRLGDEIPIAEPTIGPLKEY